MKSRGGKSQRRGEKKKEDQGRERVRRRKMQVREKVAKSWNTVFFQWFVTLEGRKVGSQKRRVRSHLARWEMKNCTRLWREERPEVKMYKTHQVRTTFASWDVEKVHAVVARSTFRSQKCKKLRGHRALLDVQMSLCVAGAGDCAPCQKWAKREGFVAVSTTTTTFHYTTLHYTTFHYNYSYSYNYNFTALHFATLYWLQYTTVHYPTLNCTTLHYPTLHYTPLHYAQLHFTTLHSTTLHYTPLHYTTLKYITLHYTTRHYTNSSYNHNHNCNCNCNYNYITLHHTTPHHTTPHCTALHCTALHSFTLHYTALQQLQLLQLRYFTLHYTGLHYTTLP